MLHQLAQNLQDRAGSSELRARKRLTVLSPVHNEEAGLDALHHRLVHVMDGLDIDWELILIDDGSSDNSAIVIRRLCDTDVEGSISRSIFYLPRFTERYTPNDFNYCGS